MGDDKGIENYINECLYARMSGSSNQILEALRASGEPTRIRILALLQQGDLAVSELVQILDQSQPRLSHHLKTLTTAGLVERLPEGAWVFYRAVSAGWARRLLNAIFAEIDTLGGDFASDTQALTKVRSVRAASAEAYFGAIAEDWDNIRALHFPNEAIEQALLDIAGPGPFNRIIDLGTGTGRMLILFSPLTDEAEGLDLSHQMLTVARANLTRAGVTNARVRQGDVSNTPFDTSGADIVIIHQVLHFIENPPAVLSEAARLLRPGGRLLVVDFARHTLDFMRERYGHHRLGVRDEDMTEWAKAAGLTLQPPLRFDPPKTLEQGLCVHVWTATLPENQQEAAA